MATEVSILEYADNNLGFTFTMYYGVSEALFKVFGSPAKICHIKGKMKDKEQERSLKFKVNFKICV